MTPKFRPYQNDGLEAIKENYRRGINAGAIVWATGLGKTVLLSEIPKLHNKRTLVLVHTRKLVKQGAKAITDWNPGLEVGIEMGVEHALPNCRVIVGSVQTLGTKAGSKRLLDLNPDDFGAVLIDETHHVKAATYLNILKHFNLVGPNKRTDILLVGVTATLYRGDNQGFDEIFDTIHHEHNIMQGIEEGWLTPLRAYTVETSVNLDSVRASMGELRLDDLAKAVNIARRNDLLIRKYLEVAKGRQAVAFTAGVEHAISFAALAREKYGIKAAAVWGEDPDLEEKMKLVDSGETELVCNDSLLLEGWDNKNISCVILARPMKAKGPVAQGIGRATRLQPGIDNLKEALAAGHDVWKTFSIVIDAHDSSSKHNLASAATLFGLPSNVKMNGQDMAKAATKIQEIKDKKGSIDLSNLKDLEKLDAHLVEIELFRQDNTVLQHSKYNWVKLNDDKYILSLPTMRDGRKQFAKIEKVNGLWKSDIDINNSQTSDTASHLAEAFRFSDAMARRFGGKLLVMKDRNAAWRNLPISGSQLPIVKNQLKMLGFDGMDANTLTRGQAADIMDKGMIRASKLAGKVA